MKKQSGEPRIVAVSGKERPGRRGKEISFEPDRQEYFSGPEETND